MITPPLRQALEDVTRVERLLVALDFDGTLAPEVDDPAQARALPLATSAIAELTGLDRTTVALVSGRAIESLSDVAGVPASVLMIGSHGVEVRLDASGPRNTLTDDELATVQELGGELERVTRPIHGAWVEKKPAGFAVHTREASHDDAHQAHAFAVEAANAVSGDLTKRRGKNLVEFSVRATTKGDAVRDLRRHARARAVIYIGDDVTDEDAFAALESGDVGIKSGPGDTKAAFRVGGPEDVARVVHLIAQLRGAATARV